MMKFRKPFKDVLVRKLKSGINPDELKIRIGQIIDELSSTMNPEIELEQKLRARDAEIRKLRRELKKQLK